MQPLTSVSISSVGASAPAPATTPIPKSSRWLNQYRSDQRAVESLLENARGLRQMDGVELLRLQALTQRFSIQTDVVSRLADRFQNSARQLLQQGG